jgi:hypothetical protein
MSPQDHLRRAEVDIVVLSRVVDSLDIVFLSHVPEIPRAKH